MIYYLLITAFTVSIDSFVCGFSLSLNKNKKLPIVVCIAITVFLMCLFTNYLTVFFADKINEKTASFGGLLLIVVGIFNLIKEKDDISINSNKFNLLTYLLAGFAVGLDGALANLSLALMGINAFFVPVTIALTHAIMIYFGIELSQTSIAKKFAKIEFIPPLILILLGGYKLLGLFI